MLLFASVVVMIFLSYFLATQLYQLYQYVFIILVVMRVMARQVAFLWVAEVNLSPPIPLSPPQPISSSSSTSSSWANSATDQTSRETHSKSSFSWIFSNPPPLLRYSTPSKRNLNPVLLAASSY